MSSTELRTTDQYDAEAQERARQMRPNLDPNASKGTARTYRSLVRHLSVAIECNDLRTAGVRDVAKIIADRRGLTASAVRVLLHRASGTHGITIIEPPAVPSLEGALRIVSDWCVEANEIGGVDAGDLAWRLEQAGYPLPEDDR